MAVAKVWLVGRIGFNSENGRYGLLVSDLWEYDGFHCGEAVQVYIDGKWVQTSFEMSDNEWYLTDTPYRGNSLEGLTGRIVRLLDSRYWDIDSMESAE